MFSNVPCQPPPYPKIHSLPCKISVAGFPLILENDRKTEAVCKAPMNLGLELCSLGLNLVSPAHGLGDLCKFYKFSFPVHKLARVVASLS